MTRAERLAQVRALIAEGMTHNEIAAQLGVSRSTVRNVLNDPDGSKQRARRDTYKGTCIDCGAKTHSDGTAQASPRCPACAHEFHHPKQWTRAAIVHAIQEWARDHGRPPTADDWLHASPDGRFPNRGSVYHNRGERPQIAAFRYWADAIEAAGYPRPTSGRRTYKEVHTMEYDRKGYTILREVEGHWEVVGESDEGTQVGALNATLNGHQPEGRWVAVPGRYWRPRELRPRTIYDWAEETTAA